MKFDKILEYQKIDQELLALESEVAKSDARNKYAVAKTRVENATETVGKLKQEAAELLNDYVQMKDKIDKLTAELDDFDGIMEDVQDIKEAEQYLKMITAISDNLAALEKEAGRDAGKIDAVNENYKKTWEQGVKATDAYKAAKAEYDNFVRERQPKVLEIKNKLAALKNEIPVEIMDAYTALRQAKKMPAFVEYDPTKSVCGRCFMDVPNDTKAKLKNAGDHAECPNCRRILYIPEK